MTPTVAALPVKDLTPAGASAASRATRPHEDAAACIAVVRSPAAPRHLGVPVASRRRGKIANETRRRMVGRVGEHWPGLLKNPRAATTGPRRGVHDGVAAPLDRVPQPPRMHNTCMSNGLCPARASVCAAQRSRRAAVMASCLRRPCCRTAAAPAPAVGRARACVPPSPASPHGREPRTGRRARARRRAGCLPR
jgi:hypothetical protein